MKNVFQYHFLLMLMMVKLYHHGRLYYILHYMTRLVSGLIIITVFLCFFFFLCCIFHWLQQHTHFFSSFGSFTELSGVSKKSTHKRLNITCYKFLQYIIFFMLNTCSNGMLNWFLVFFYSFLFIPSFSSVFIRTTDG